MRHVMHVATMGVAVLLAAATSGAAAEGKIPRLVVKGPLDAMVGHVQGACASEDAIYLSHIAGIFKLDWDGNVIKHVKAERHTGDLCYHDGKVYSVLGKWGSGGKTKVCRLQVRDADLNFVAEKPLPELKGLDGVTVLDGIIYHGVGYSSPVPRSSHSLGRIDLKTLESLPQVVFELPYQTHFCQQNRALQPSRGNGFRASAQGTLPGRASALLQGQFAWWQAERRYGEAVRRDAGFLRAGRRAVPRHHAALNAFTRQADSFFRLARSRREMGNMVYYPL